ncbi:hypothetical protein [Flavobacterium sp. W21_SRS_FM6]|uniref:hypothetical protein n=1 Tax=Flavobacterium sp. W21_SRS_FM6 TaxID=3240268 RepID=UPI003F8F76AC
MKTVFFSMLLLASQLSHAQCDIDPTHLRAEYTLQTHKNDQTAQKSSLILWRDGHTVAHQFPQTNITESWYLLKNQHIKPTRFFDHYKRAIEYQPGEKVHGKSEKDWLYRYQLVSQALLSQLELSSESGEGCNQEQTFSKDTPQGKIVVKWLPALNLLSYFSSTVGGQQEIWQLINKQSDSSQIQAFFAQRNAYQSTDFADIGDDHSDPFLAKMINLGFVEHGASGFYNADGQAIGAEHNH